METGKKIAVCLAAALAIAIFAAGAVSMVGAQDAEELAVSIDIDKIDFNVVMLGEIAEIARAFTLTNDGPIDAMVQASSTGLSDGLKKIPAQCLSIKGVQLSESDTDIATVGAGRGSVVEFDVVLSVLEDQEPGSYSGTIELTFTHDVLVVDPDVPFVDPDVPFVDPAVPDPDVPFVDPNVPDPDVPVALPDEDNVADVADEDSVVGEDTVADVPGPPEE